MNRAVTRTLGIMGSLALCLTIIACSPGNPQAAEWQKTVDALAALQGQGIPQHFLQDDAARTGEEFDVNIYFSVLDHLAMEAGYVLDYVYQYDSMGGYPILYARPADQPPYRTAAEYGDAVEGSDPAADRYSYADHVQVDGTADGFFQFVVLRIMGGQFYLYWHAAYNDAVIICDRDTLEAILAATDEFGQELPADLKQRARTLNIDPLVEFQEDRVLVKVVVFSKWGGFMRLTYAIGRNFPHTISQEEPETLVPYDCGVRF